MVNTESIITPQQAATILVTNRRTVTRLCATGKLPAKNIGTGNRNAIWRIRMADLQAFMQPDNTPTAPAPRTPKLPAHVRDIASKFM
jgi:excisionase family DNA binding protein